MAISEVDALQLRFSHEHIGRPGCRIWRSFLTSAQLVLVTIEVLFNGVPDCSRHWLVSFGKGFLWTSLDQIHDLHGRISIYLPVSIIFLSGPKPFRWLIILQSYCCTTLMTHIFSRFGSPLQLLTDRGSEFESELFSQLMKWMEIDKLRTTAYQQSTNGAVGRFHRTLNMLGKVVSDTQRDWDDKLPAVMAAYRASLTKVLVIHLTGSFWDFGFGHGPPS